MNELIARGANVKASVDTHWKRNHTPESVEALLQAGLDTTAVDMPSGYDEVDGVLRQYAKKL